MSKIDSWWFTKWSLGKNLYTVSRLETFSNGPTHLRKSKYPQVKQ